jgi:hypothetical protein
MHALARAPFIFPVFRCTVCTPPGWLPRADASPSRAAPGAAIESGSLLASEWLSSASDRGWVKAANEVLKRLRRAHKDASYWFGTPVPPAVSDYHKIIFHPMDLTTVETKLKDGGFATPDEWIAAVRTIFRNCFVYNRRDDPTGAKVLAIAEVVSAAFEKELLRMRGVVPLDGR